MDHPISSDKQRWRRRFLPLLAALCVALAAAPAAAETVPRSVVLEYAPKVYFDPGERFFPYSPAAFIARSELDWSGCRTSNPRKRRGTIVPSKLGVRSAHPYFSPWLRVRKLLGPLRIESCSEKRANGAARFRSGDYTRPYGGGRGRLLSGRDGFVLDAADAIHPGYAGAPSNAPLFYESGVTGAGNYFVNYWFFYAYDQFKRGVTWQAHEGDWEQLAVLLTPDMRLFAAAYAAHGHFATVQRGDVPLANGTHPRAYVARGSHATYATPGSHPVAGPFHDQAGEGGTTWNSWAFPGDFAPGDEQGWWGFGGAWGSTSRLGAEYSGPLGPGPHKPRYPEEWDGGGTRTLPLEAPVGVQPPVGEPHPTPPPVNPPPTAAGASFTMARNGGPNGVTYVKALHASDDKGIAAWQLLYQDFGSGSQNFTWYGDGRFGLKPTAPPGARLSFEYRVLDNEGAASDRAQVTIVVCQNGTATPCPP